MDLMNLKKMNKPTSFRLWVYVTGRCNLKCKHCYINSSYLKNEMTLRDLYKILEDYIYFLRVLNIKGGLTLTGGEPLIRKDIFKFLEKISQHREILNFGILSNGTLFTKGIVKELKKNHINGVGLGIEGMEKNNDFIRGKGTFKKIVKTAKMLVESKIPVGFGFTANKLNYKDLPAVVRLAEKIGVSHITASILVPEGRGKKMKNFMLSPTELKDYYKKANFLSQSLKRKKNGPGMHLTKSLHFLAKESKRDFICNSLQKGKILSIMPNGDVHPCGFISLNLGNIRERSLIDIYFNSLLVKLRHSKKLSSQCGFIRAYCHSNQNY